MFVYISNYTRAVVQENSLFGTPAQRPLFMEFPDDDTAWTITYQYMFGNRLLVAPVIASNVKTSLVYLPKGFEWMFLWDGKNYPGGNYTTVDSPLGMPPVFYKVTDNHLYDDLFAAVRIKFPLIPAPPTTQPPPTTKAVNAAADTRTRFSCVVITFMVFVLAYL